MLQFKSILTQYLFFNIPKTEVSAKYFMNHFHHNDIDMEQEETMKLSILQTTWNKRLSQHSDRKLMAQIAVYTI